MSEKPDFCSSMEMVTSPERVYTGKCGILRGKSVNSGEFPIKMHESQRGWCHTTYLRYRFGCEDPKAPGGVLGRVELPAAEVELIG